MGTNSKRSVAKSDKSCCWPAAGGSSCWTNELHLQYLNSVEASFVRTFLCDDDVDDVDRKRDNHKNIITTSILGGAGGHSPPPPRLDRYLPDSSESTLDLFKSTHDHLHRPRPRRHSASDILDQREGGGRRLIRSSQSSRRSACQDHDQVVPQLEK